MKLIKLITFIFILNSISGTSQELTKWEGKSQLMTGIYHFGSYAKEGPIFFLEQHFFYNFNHRYSIGIGAGLDIYPGGLALPIMIEGKYNFTLFKKPAFFSQSIGKYILSNELFFSANRNVGAFGLVVNPDKKVLIVPEIGYSYLWDKYGGKELSFLINLGVQYSIQK